jgi:hypothetical protein
LVSDDSDDDFITDCKLVTETILRVSAEEKNIL